MVWIYLIKPQLKEPIPLDLLAANTIAILTAIFTLTPYLSALPFRIPLGLLLVLFLPGYAFVAALYPRRGEINHIERVSLSVGFSIVAMPMVGFALNFTYWGIRLGPIVIGLITFIAVFSAIAYLRRIKLPPEERFSIKTYRLDTIRDSLTPEKKGILNRSMMVILLISIVVSATTVLYITINPKQEEGFTEFYILGLNRTASDYPTSIVAGNDYSVILGIVNNEHRTVNYTLSLEFRNSTLLNRTIKLNRLQAWEKIVNYSLGSVGDRQRLKFLLYKDDNFTAPYRELYLLVNVSNSREMEKD